MSCVTWDLFGTDPGSAGSELALICYNITNWSENSSVKEMTAAHAKVSDLTSPSAVYHLRPARTQMCFRREWIYVPCEWINEGLMEEELASLLTELELDITPPAETSPFIPRTVSVIMWLSLLKIFFSFLFYILFSVIWCLISSFSFLHVFHFIFSAALTWAL